MCIVVVSVTMPSRSLTRRVAVVLCVNREDGLSVNQPPLCTYSAIVAMSACDVRSGYVAPCRAISHASVHVVSDAVQRRVRPRHARLGGGSALSLCSSQGSGSLTPGDGSTMAPVAVSAQVEAEVCQRASIRFLYPSGASLAL